MNIMKSTKEPRHIVLYIGSLSRGGAEHVLSNLAEYFCVEGYRVTLVTTYRDPVEYYPAHAGWPAVEPGYENEKGLVTPAVSYPSVPGEKIGRVYSGLLKEEEKSRFVNPFLRVRKLRQIFKDLKADLVIAFLGKNNVMALLAAGSLKIPTIVSVRSDPAREYAPRGINIGMRLLFPRAAAVVLQTTRARLYFPPSVQAVSVIMPNDLDPRYLRPLYEGEREKVVVTVGRLDDNKNQGLLLRAFAKTRQEHPEYRLLICGDGPSREKFEKLAAELGIGEAVTFTGNVSDVPERIEKASIFVLPSKKEGMPNALLESMALGLTCISTDCPCGGPADVITYGENGILVPVDDEAAMAQALLNCMDDPVRARRMGEAAVKVREINDPDRVHGLWKILAEGAMEK